ncbi:MAG: methyltransferase [Bacillales bacterium]|jgi:SAM-dependent methyltransferase|nr:methyltransferase [Bacillales bacterium]
MTEDFYDEILNVNTCGDQNGFNKIYHYHRYEPTPYSALETLFETYKLKSSDYCVDFGCGKGRLNFYINHLFKSTVTGVEMNKLFYQDALENLDSFNKHSKDRIHFHCCLAEEYEIQPLDNRFYFFNPFSDQIFITVVNNILRSYEENHREIDLILYYPSEDYIFFLENNTVFELISEVRLPGLYETNNQERFQIYRIS